MNDQGHSLNSKGAREIENQVKMYLITTDCDKCWRLNRLMCERGRLGRGGPEDPPGDDIRGKNLKTVDNQSKFSSVQSPSHVRLFVTPWTAARQASLSIMAPTPGACSNSCSWSQWYHPTISSSVVPFSSRLHSFPASGSFPKNQFFASGGQSIAVSASASVLPMNIQDWFPLELTGLISLQSKGLSRVFSNTTVQKHQFNQGKSLHQNQNFFWCFFPNHSVLLLLNVDRAYCFFPPKKRNLKIKDFLEECTPEVLSTTLVYFVFSENIIVLWGFPGGSVAITALPL